jgi:hypothetical protein
MWIAFEIGKSRSTAQYLKAENGWQRLIQNGQNAVVGISDELNFLET